MAETTFVINKGNFDIKKEDFDFHEELIELGIDEAGRGPVLGVMVYGCVFWPKRVGDQMREKFGFNDSKQVAEAMREKMFDDIKSIE